MPLPQATTIWFRLANTIFKEDLGLTIVILWQQKLFVTPGNLARFAHVPGFAQPEAAASVNQRADKYGGTDGSYWVTVTEASSSLWSCIRTGDEKFTKTKPVDPRTIHIRRCDAPLPQSTALVIRRLWLTMLNQTTPLSHSERYFAVDATSEIFSAVNPEGKLLEAQAPTFESRNTDELVRIGFLLLDYCHIHEPERPEIARKIEIKARTLLARVSRSKNTKK